MIPSRLQVGTAGAESWRSAPAPHNPAGDEQGTWAVMAGDPGEESDVYFEIIAEQPKVVAEFVVAAVRGHASASRFTAAVADVELERKRVRSRCAEVTPANPSLPDALKLACLAEGVGSLARELTSDRFSGDQAGRDKRLYAELTELAAGVVGWMEAILSRDNDEHGRHKAGTA
jgi:hypothetical protein